MAIEYWRLLQLRDGNLSGAREAAKLILTNGDVSLPRIPDNRVSAELDLDYEWTKQAAKLADFFAPLLMISRDEYIASLPKFDPQPESYKGRFDFPLIVPMHQISFSRILQQAGIQDMCEADNMSYWENENRSGNKSMTPMVTYTTWVNPGVKISGKSFGQVLGSLGSDERGGSAYDGLALYLRNPAIIKQAPVVLPGTTVGESRDRVTVLENRLGLVGLFGYTLHKPASLDYPIFLAGKKTNFR